MPTWGWIVLIALAVIVTPIKLKMFKKILSKKEENVEED